MPTSRTVFGKLLRAKRKASGLSQDALAKKLHLSDQYISDVERGVRNTLARQHWRALVKALRDLTLADLERAAAQSGTLEIELRDAPAEYVDVVIAAAEAARNRSLPAGDLESVLGLLRASWTGSVRAHGRIVDSSGAPVAGHAFVYRLSRARGWVGLVGARAHAGLTAGPLDGHLAVVTDKRVDLLRSGDPRGAGFFDVPGGLAPGDYALDVHVGDAKAGAWAWPFVVTDGAEPQDVRIGGAAAGAAPGAASGAGASQGGSAGGGSAGAAAALPPQPGLVRQFTKGTFTASLSYYGLGSAPLERIQRDLERFRRAGFANARVWTEWQKPAPDARFFARDGSPIAAQIAKLRAALDFAAGLGMTFDLTMSAGRYDAAKQGGGTGEATYDIAPHKSAVRFLCTELREHPGIAFIDLGNEHNQRGQGGDGSPASGHISPGRAKELIDVARAADPSRRLTLSTEGDAATAKDAYAKVLKRGVKLDLFTPHFPRHPGWGAEEGKNAKALGYSPVHHQEPARRGEAKDYDAGTWSVADFEASFRSARAAGSVGCCFHTDAAFDLSAASAWDQLDEVERDVVAHAAEWLR